VASKKPVTSNKIVVTHARLAFANLDELEYFNPQAPKANEKKMSRATLLIDPTTVEGAKTIAEIKAEAKRIAIEYWGEAEATRLFANRLINKCYGTEESLKKVYDGYKGMFWVKIAADRLPPIVGRNRTGPVDPKTGRKTFIPVKPGDAEFPYNGSYVNGPITLWTQDSHGRIGINANMLTLQFNEKGVEFGRPSADPDGEFDALEDVTAPDATPDDIFN
jgi:hypothetical protein